MIFFTNIVYYLCYLITFISILVRVVFIIVVDVGRTVRTVPGNVKAVQIDCRLYNNLRTRSAQALFGQFTEKNR